MTSASGIAPSLPSPPGVASLSSLDISASPPTELVGRIFSNFKHNRRSSRNRAWSQMGADIAGSVGRFDADHLNRIKLAEGILGDIEDRVKGGDQGAGQSPLDALRAFLNGDPPTLISPNAELDPLSLPSGSEEVQ